MAIAARRPRLRLEIDGRVVEVGDFRVEPDGTGMLEIDGRATPFRRAVERGKVHLDLAGQPLTIGVLGRRDDDVGRAADDGTVRAPMPGIVVKVFCEPGQSVAQGQLLMTIESMKLQSELKAPCDGVVAAVDVAVGDAFDRNAPLISFERPPAADNPQ